jgi:hypothetical protein
MSRMPGAPLPPAAVGFAAGLMRSRPEDGTKSDPRIRWDGRAGVAVGP